MAVRQEMKNDNNDEQDEFCIRDDPRVVLDQYLDGEELKELILEEENVLNNDLPKRTSHIGVFYDFQFKKNIKNVLKYFIMPPPTSRIKNCNTTHSKRGIVTIQDPSTF